MQVSLALTPSIIVPDSPPHYCSALLMSLAVGTQVTSWIVPELLFSFSNIYHFVIPDSESQRSRLTVVQQSGNKSLFPLPFLQVLGPLFII